MKFYKYGVEVFDGCYTKYGGHWQWFNKILNLFGLHWYKLVVCLCKWKWDISKPKSFYHDGGYIKSIYIGFIAIGWESSVE